MAYLYESIQNGIFRFTLPGEDKTVTLFKGSTVTVDQKLSGGYLRVLKLVKEIEPEPTVEVETKKATVQATKVADKITKVEEVIDVQDEVKIETNDTIVEITEEKESTEQIVNTQQTVRKGRRRK